jgi:hypothetical protein
VTVFLSSSLSGLAAKGPNGKYLSPPVIKQLLLLPEQIRTFSSEPVEVEIIESKWPFKILVA